MMFGDGKGRAQPIANPQAPALPAQPNRYRFFRRWIRTPRQQRTAIQFGGKWHALCRATRNLPRNMVGGLPQGSAIAEIGDHLVRAQQSANIIANLEVE